MRITYQMIRDAMHGKPYPMELVGVEAQAVLDAVNQGIDAHLEACNIVGQDRYEWGERRTAGGVVHTVFLGCEVSVASLPVLLRRLYERSGEDRGDATPADIAETLCVDILDSIGFPDLFESGFEIISPADEVLAGV